MGFFSWRTQDTDKSIANHYSIRPTFRVYMTDNKGNRWEEDNYAGYGVFGGKDYYELLAEMNGLKTRSEGIDYFFESDKCLCPNLTEDPNWVWRDESPERCEDQGYFYEGIECSVSGNILTEGWTIDGGKYYAADQECAEYICTHYLNCELDDAISKGLCKWEKY